MNKNISKSSLFFYSILATPLAFANLPLYIFAPDFYATQYNLSLNFIGISLLIIRVIDAFQDPIIGHISDKYWNNYKKTIFFSFIIFTISFASIFVPNNNYIKLWFFLSLLLTTTSYSIVTINFQSLGSYFSNIKKEKTIITAAREIMSLIGLLLAAITPTILAIKYEIKFAMQIYSIIFILLAILTSSLFFYKLSATKYQNNKKAKFKIFFRNLKKHKSFFIIFLISITASVIPAILFMFFVRDKLNAENYSGLFLSLYFIAAILAMPLWHKLAAKKGKYKTWLAAMILAVLSFIFAYFLEEKQILEFAIICIFSGLAFAADLILPPAILSDLLKKNSENTAINFSLLTLISKLALGISAAIILPILEKSGYKSGLLSTGKILNFYYALLPCFIKISAIIILTKLILQKKQYEI